MICTLLYTILYSQHWEWCKYSALLRYIWWYNLWCHQHTEAETKWVKCCKWHFQMCFSNEELHILIRISLQLLSSNLQWVILGSANGWAPNRQGIIQIYNGLVCWRINASCDNDKINLPLLQCIYVSQCYVSFCIRRGPSTRVYTNRQIQMHHWRRDCGVLLRNPVI